MQGFFWGEENILKLYCDDGCNNSVNILKCTELYTLNEEILWFVNYILKKLLKSIKLRDSLLKNRVGKGKKPTLQTWQKTC